MRATTASEQGWGLREPVDGFVPVGCYLHVPVSSGPGDERLQCFFSDGLVDINLYSLVFLGKEFVKGTIFPAQRISPQPAGTLVT